MALEVPYELLPIATSLGPTPPKHAILVEFGS